MKDPRSGRRIYCALEIKGPRSVHLCGAVDLLDFLSVNPVQNLLPRDRVVPDGEFLTHVKQLIVRLSVI